MFNIFDPNYLKDVILSLPWILLALSFHEFCHAYVSYRLGDPTPKQDGRLTLNPLRHINPMGLIVLILFQFIWAKPVLTKPNYYKNPMKGMVWVSLAGPIGNFILAIIFTIIIRITLLTKTQFDIIEYFIRGLQICIGIGIFNLIPIPPLDGSKVLRYFLKGNIGYQFDRIEPYGIFIILLILFIPNFSYLFSFLINSTAKFLLGF